MNYFIFVILICFFVSLFCIYSLGREDYVFLRRDITLDKLFNIAFLVLFFGLFLSRAIFAASFSPRMFLDPLVFSLFPYFPGLSLAGGVMGGILFTIFLSGAREYPTERILDIFSMAFLVSLPFGYLGYFSLTLGRDFPSLILAVVYTLLSFIFIKFIYQLFLKARIKDGSLSFLFLLVFSIITLVSNIIPKYKHFEFLRQPDNYLLLLLFFSAVFLLIRGEKIIKFRKR